MLTSAWISRFQEVSSRVTNWGDGRRQPDAACSANNDDGWQHQATTRIVAGLRIYGTAEMVVRTARSKLSQSTPTPAGIDIAVIHR